MLMPAGVLLFTVRYFACLRLDLSGKPFGVVLVLRYESHEYASRDDALDVRRESFGLLAV